MKIKINPVILPPKDTWQTTGLENSFTDLIIKYVNM